MISITKHVFGYPHCQGIKKGHTVGAKIVNGLYSIIQRNENVKSKLDLEAFPLGFSHWLWKVRDLDR